MKLVYVSGPYSGPDTPKHPADGAKTTSQNIQVAREHSIRIWERGDAALCPHLNTAHFEYDCEATYDDYMAGDLLMVEAASVIYMLPGWRNSKGARLEYEHALKLGKQIEYAEGAENE